MSLCPQALLLMNSITSDERFSPKIRQKEGGGGGQTGEKKSINLSAFLFY